MRTNSKKILGAVAVAGLVAATGSAFTGTGITRGTGAQENDFVGGTVQQTVAGATLSGVVYNAPGAGTDVNSVDVTFTSVLDSGQVVTAIVNGVTTSPITCTEPTGSTYNCLVPDPGTVNTLDIIVSDSNAADPV